MSVPVWHAPWIDLEDPSDHYEKEWLVEWITKHARYDGLICCHINVHKLRLDMMFPACHSCGKKMGTR